MKSKGIGALFLLLFASPVPYEAREIRGRVEITDEKGVASLPLPCEVRVNAAPLGKSKTTDTRCSDDEGVDSDTGSFSYLVPEDCKDLDLELWVELYPPFPWEKQPELRLVIWPQETVNFVGLDPFRVIRPSKPETSARQASFQKAVSLADKDWSTSLALFKEASRGGDVRFTMESIDFIEKKAAASSGEERSARFQSVYEFISEAEPDLAFDAPDNKFRLALRKANAALGAGQYKVTLESVAQALTIYPRNDQAPAVAYIALTEEFQTNDPAELSTALEVNTDRFVVYQEVYDRWQAPGKPALLVEGEVHPEVNTKALYFVRKNADVAYR